MMREAKDGESMAIPESKSSLVSSDSAGLIEQNPSLTEAVSDKGNQKVLNAMRKSFQKKAVTKTSGM